MLPDRSVRRTITLFLMLFVGDFVKEDVESIVRTVENRMTTLLSSTLVGAASQMEHVLLHVHLVRGIECTRNSPLVLKCDHYWW